MAEAMILSAVEKLETLLAKKRRRFRGGEEQVQGLRDDLREMFSLLTHSSTGDINHRYISLLRDMAHEADSAIDIFILKRENKTKNSRFSPVEADRINFLTRIDDIRSSLEDLKHEYDRFEEAEPPTRSATTLLQRRRNVREAEVVGMEEDVKLLLEEAIFDEAGGRRLSTSCIVGMGGVGKTTLAEKLYTHERVASEFEVRAWVYVESSAKEVFKEMILQLGMKCDESAAETMMVEDLRDMVFRHLQSRRYFVVLDHVWRDADLEFLLTAFPDNDKGSRLVLTSRIRDIIGHAQYIHERKTLDPHESWQLFLKTVFGEHTKCSNQLEEIGRKIVTKCDGLPLAIIEAGDKLSKKKQSEREWASFLETMDLSSTLEVLELSYHKMQSPITKSCFLHLGSFMEGTTIRVEKLVQVWTAGGILVSRGEQKNETDEEIGKKCLDELINDCMFEVKGRSNRDYRVKYCYMNYNLHRLAVTKAKDEIRLEVRTKNDGTSKQSRHCVICCSREKFDYYTDHDELFVSLLFRGGGNFDATSDHWKRFKLLKILDFEDFGLKALPDAVGELISLQYLGLRNNYIKKLPYSLGSLKRLEVLDIALNFMVEVLDVIRNIKSLRHLYMSDIICSEPLRMDTLKNLQTLTYISVHNLRYELTRFQMMSSLRKLGLHELDGILDISKILASLAEMKNLDCLNLRASPLRSLPSLDELGILNRLTQLN